MMRFEDIESLLGAYALDAVDPEERAVVEQYLASHPRSRAEVSEYQEVATLLAYSGAAAPDGLWDRIAGALEGEGAPEPGSELAKVLPMGSPTSARRGVPPPPLPARSRAWGRPWLAVAAVAAVAAAVILPLSLTVRDQSRQIDQAEDSALESLYDDARSAAGSRRAELVSPDGEVALAAVVSADGAGFVQADDLPRLADDQTYQLWAMLPDRVVSLGVLGPDPTLAAFRSDLAGADTATLAITAERAGGVTATEQRPVAAGELA